MRQYGKLCFEQICYYAKIIKIYFILEYIFVHIKQFFKIYLDNLVCQVITEWGMVSQ